MNTLGETIAALRKKQGLTQEALANLIGVSAQSVSKWENNTNMPDISLLPLLADLFSCRIDDLFGREGTKNRGDSNRALDNCCEAVLEETFCAFRSKTLSEEEMTEYRKALRENDNQRSAIFNRHGIVYYREKLGALLLKKPEEGWYSLLENKEAENVIRLLGDGDFRKVLAEICRSRTYTFTLSSLCCRCEIQDSASLEEKLKECQLFDIKTVDVDGSRLTIYDVVYFARLAMLYTVLDCAAEYAEYKEMYTCCVMCGMKELLG